MRNRSVVLTAAALLTTMTGCAPQSGCAVGYDPAFRLRVSYGEVEPAVRFCADDQCSPVPAAGRIRDFSIDTRQEDGALVRRLAPGLWTISPRGGPDAPTTAEIELYTDGERISTTRVHLHWPEVDPCAASKPPEPDVTVSAG